MPTTAVLSGTIDDLIGSLDPKYLARITLVIEANTPGSLLLDTAGNRHLAGAKRIPIDKNTGAYSVSLVTTNSADIVPTTGRLYRATLIYPSGTPGAGNVTQVSGWFQFTAAASLADIWPGLATTEVATTVYENMTDSLMTGIDSNSASGFRVQQDARLAATYGRGIISITDPRFGAAVGNTAAANQTAIQAALDYVGTAGGGTVYVPPGTFLHNDAFSIPSNVHLRGSGTFSILKATSLVDGGAGSSHRQIEANAKTGFRISDLMLDASEMAVFTAGMRSILCKTSTDYSIERVHFRTPGAAVASIGCSKFTIDRPVVTIAATDGIAHHDGVIDQWGGCNNFKVIEPTVYGGGIGKYGILVTGENTDGTPAACYDFTISNPSVFSCKSLGIWVNGREGINHSFTIANPLVDGVTDFHGIVISDSYAWSLASPVVKNVGRNGIKVYTETGEGGATGGDDGTISSPVVYNANTTMQAAADDGAAIAILDGSDGVTLAGARVKGTLHTYAVYFASTITNCFHGRGSYQTGTLGKTVNDPAGGSYTPTATAVANVATTSISAAVWTREADIITVRGRISVTPTAGASTATQVGISLPVASNLATATTDLFGVASTAFDQIAAISSDVTNDRAQLQFPAPGTAAYNFYYTYTYRVL